MLTTSRYDVLLPFAAKQERPGRLRHQEHAEAACDAALEKLGLRRATGQSRFGRRPGRALTSELADHLTINES